MESHELRMLRIRTNASGTRSKARGSLLDKSFKRTAMATQVVPVRELIGCRCPGHSLALASSERMCKHFTEDFKLDTKVVRYHNIYGPLGTYDGGREKAPAALCRKIADAKINDKKEIEVWGDGEQTRTFLYIDDCLDGSEAVFSSSRTGPYNVGSDEQVSINQMIDMIEEIADYKVKRKYDTSKPKGVRGRSSNNDLIKKEIGWEPKIKLKEGLRHAYEWIFDEIRNGNNSKSNKFTRT